MNLIKSIGLIRTFSLNQHSRSFSSISSAAGGLTLLPNTFYNNSSSFDIQEHLINNNKNPSLTTVTFHNPILPKFSNSVRFKKNKIKTPTQTGTKKKKGNNNQVIDDDDDEFDDEEEEDDYDEDLHLLSNTPAAKFISDYYKKGKSGSKKSSGGKNHKIGAPADYKDVRRVIDAENYWNELETIQADLITYFNRNLSLKTANTVDDLPINLEGDVYPLHEIAKITKNDPKYIIIDASTFPESASEIYKVVSKSGLAQNVQKDGFKIIIPLPKITKESRERLAKSAKTQLTEAKEKTKNVQNKYLNLCNDKEISETCKVPKDKFKSIKDIILAMAQHFNRENESSTEKKQNEILGKK